MAVYFWDKWKNITENPSQLVENIYHSPEKSWNVIFSVVHTTAETETFSTLIRSSSIRRRMEEMCC